MATHREAVVPTFNKQCGFLLFNVGKKHDSASTNGITLDRTISVAASRKECSNGAGAGAPPACGAGEGDCTGYVLEALGKK